MLKNSGCILFVSVFAVIILFTGCVTEKMAAEYVVPPKVIKDLSAVNIIDVLADVEVAGNALKPADKQQVVQFLTAKITSDLGRNGYYQVTDRIWSNVDGASELEDILRKEKNLHGYGRITTASDFKRAQLLLNLQVKMDSDILLEELKFELMTIPYVREDNEKIPSSLPDKKNVVLTPVDVHVETPVLNVVGTLNATLVDKEGVVVYKKSFNNLNKSFKFSVAKRQTIPTGNFAISALLNSACKEIVKDLSPHTEIRYLIPNLSGNKSAVILLQAQAFVEAIEELDSLLAEQIKNNLENAADYENRGLAYEVIGDYYAALSDFQRASEIDPTAKTAISSIERIEKILLLKSEMKDMRQQTKETLYKSQKFN